MSDVDFISFLSYGQPDDLLLQHHSLLTQIIMHNSIFF